MPEPKKKVTVWETFDGKEFEFKGDAERHESALWEKMGANFQAINDHFENYEHQRILDEYSSMWRRYEGNEAWPSSKKKEGLMFIKTLYRIHQILECESLEGNTKYLGMD